LDSPPKNNIKETLQSTPEGRLLIVGITLAGWYAVWLAIELFVNPDRGQQLVAMTAIDVIFGRAAAMAFGFSAGLNRPAVIAICASIETVLVMLFYPLFVFAFRNLLVIKWMNNMFVRTRRVAERHKVRVERYGFIGLFFFVWLPFWLTGPVVGCVVGFLLGMRIRTNMIAVISGTCVAISCWAVLLETLHVKVSTYNPYAATVLVLILVAVAYVAHLLHKAISERKSRINPPQEPGNEDRNA